MTTLERALEDPPMYAPRLEACNDNEPDEGVINDDRQIQFNYPLDAP